MANTEKFESFFFFGFDFEGKTKYPNQQGCFFFLFQEAYSKRTSKRSEHLSLAPLNHSPQRLFSRQHNKISFCKGHQKAVCVTDDLCVSVCAGECLWSFGKVYKKEGVGKKNRWRNKNEWVRVRESDADMYNEWENGVYSFGVAASHCLTVGGTVHTRLYIGQTLW